MSDGDVQVAGAATGLLHRGPASACSHWRARFPLLAHLPGGLPAPLVGDVVRVRFDPALGALLPDATGRGAAAGTGVTRSLLV